MRIVDALGLPFPSVVAVVGCGGKTSLITQVANSCPGKRVLVSPTAKMFPLHLENADCHGILNPKTGKLEALPPGELAELIAGYDITLLEADGSRLLPCKGWMDWEPVVPSYCTHTVGIVTMNALGLAADETCVHNFPQFLALTGLQQGEAITTEALRAMVCAPGGMFKNSAGNRILFVNQAEDAKTAEIAARFLLSVKESFPGMFTRLLIGSVNNDICQEV